MTRRLLALLVLFAIERARECREQVPRWGERAYAPELAPSCRPGARR